MAALSVEVVDQDVPAIAPRPEDERAALGVVDLQVDERREVVCDPDNVLDVRVERTTYLEPERNDPFTVDNRGAVECHDRVLAKAFRECLEGLDDQLNILSQHRRVKNQP